MDAKSVCLFLFINVYSGFCFDFHAKGEKGEPGMSFIGPQGWPGPRGPPGYPGLPGQSGPTGQKGDPGIMGPRGLTGEKGEMGPVGPQGLLGYTGPKGVTGVMGPIGLPGQKGEKGSMGRPGPSGPPGYPGPRGPIGSPGQKGEQGDMGLSGLDGHPGLPGDAGTMGTRGPPGQKGDQGPIGPPGAIGFPGPKGEQGEMGPEGKPGVKGDQGPRGYIGVRRAKGAKGDQGIKGDMGAKGEHGVKGDFGTGPPGPPGMPGVCPTTCPVIELYETKVFSEDIKPNLGSESMPSPAICKFIPATRSKDDAVPAPDPYWVMKEDKFPVKCDITTNRTCLILEHNDPKWIEETKVFIGSAPRGMWLSKSGFNLDRFNTITRKQLHWLKEQSINVKQIIRVYTVNTTFDKINLRLLNAYDVVIDQSPSALTPMFYTVKKHDEIKVEGKQWQYTDLDIIDDVKRLPIEDFYVEYVPKDTKDVYISVQLRQLCFG